MERSVEQNDGMDLITSVQKIKTITYFHTKMEVYSYSQLTKQPQSSQLKGGKNTRACKRSY